MKNVLLHWNKHLQTAVWHQQLHGEAAGETRSPGVPQRDVRQPMTEEDMQPESSRPSEAPSWIHLASLSSLHRCGKSCTQHRGTWILLADKACLISSLIGNICHPKHLDWFGLSLAFPLLSQRNSPCLNVYRVADGHSQALRAWERNNGLHLCW